MQKQNLHPGCPWSPAAHCWGHQEAASSGQSPVLWNTADTPSCPEPVGLEVNCANLLEQRELHRLSCYSKCTFSVSVMSIVECMMVYVRLEECVAWVDNSYCTHDGEGSCAGKSPCMHAHLGWVCTACKVRYHVNGRALIRELDESLILVSTDIEFALHESAKWRTQFPQFLLCSLVWQVTNVQHLHRNAFHFVRQWFRAVHDVAFLVACLGGRLRISVHRVPHCGSAANRSTGPFKLTRSPC